MTPFEIVGLIILGLLAFVMAIIFVLQSLSLIVLPITWVIRLISDIKHKKMLKEFQEGINGKQETTICSI